MYSICHYLQIRVNVEYHIAAYLSKNTVAVERLAVFETLQFPWWPLLISILLEPRNPVVTALDELSRSWLNLIHFFFIGI